jgi:hypothetical protein
MTSVFLQSAISESKYGMKNIQTFSTESKYGLVDEHTIKNRLPPNNE